MGIIIKGVGIIIKGIVVIERAATFPETRLRHCLFFWCLEGCRFDEEDSEDGFLSTVGLIARVLEADEMRGRSYLAAVPINIWPNQLVRDPICTLQYSTCRTWLAVRPGQVS